MTLTELRQRLEELEREGHGARRVEVTPAPPPIKGWPRISKEDEKRCRLNFVVMNYVVDSVSIGPLSDDPPVTLRFVEAGEMPDDPDLEKAKIFELG